MTFKRGIYVVALAVYQVLTLSQCGGLFSCRWHANQRGKHLAICFRRWIQVMHATLFSDRDRILYLTAMPPPPLPFRSLGLTTSMPPTHSLTQVLFFFSFPFSMTVNTSKDDRGRRDVVLPAGRPGRYDDDHRMLNRLQPAGHQEHSVGELVYSTRRARERARASESATGE